MKRISVVGKSPEGKLLKSIHVIRLDNLNELIKQRFDGNATSMARHLGRSHAYLWQILNKYRGIGEDMARYIEERLGLEDRALDQPDTLERTEKLRAQLGNGKELLYFMVPRVTLDQLDRISFKKAKQIQACPVPGEVTVCFVVPSNTMETYLFKNEVAFANAKDRVVKDGGIYVIFPKKGPRIGVLRLAQAGEAGRFQFITPTQKDPSYEGTQVEVYGRVITVMREIA